MKELRFTLVADGPSDKRLLPIITWLLQQHSSRLISSTWADLSVSMLRPRSLEERIRYAADLYPADIIFVHRDAEGESLGRRVSEVVGACPPSLRDQMVPVVPVRMQEAWLLIDESAIRSAAGNPRGRVRLALPPASALETLPDPKQTLYQALRAASELSGRHLARLNVAAAAYRVSELIQDYSNLRGLKAFEAFEKELVSMLTRHGLDDD
jgi:hypothetical protein